ncbi:MAG: hypothetical protein JST42_26255 [Bacteroidetes bacterium]|nr:hypothetical protein [Bacteroidota bacterium]
MLQNRVDPEGNIIRTSARGAWMGNRGILHDEHQHVVRAFRLKAWITCVLEFRGRKRSVMALNRYTELFFLDEATAFSAGHRPCFECRRQDFHRFKSFWLKGNPEYGFDERTPVAEIDHILHRERIDRKGKKLNHEEDIRDLPDGAFIRWQGRPALVAGNNLYAWSPSGYEPPIALPDTGPVAVLTPASILQAFRAGYAPQMAV